MFLAKEVSCILKQIGVCDFLLQEFISKGLPSQERLEISGAGCSLPLKTVNQKLTKKFEKFQFLIFPGHPQLFLRQVTSIPVLITLVVVVEGAVVADSVVHVDHVGVLAVGLDNCWREKRSTSPRTDGLLHPGSALVTILHTLVQERQSSLQDLELTLQVCRF